MKQHPRLRSDTLYKMCHVCKIQHKSRPSPKTNQIGIPSTDDDPDDHVGSPTEVDEPSSPAHSSSSENEDDIEPAENQKLPKGKRKASKSMSERPVEASRRPNVKFSKHQKAVGLKSSPPRPSS